MRPLAMQPNRTRSWRLGGPLVAALALGALPACTLDRSVLGCDPQPAYECSVVVRDADWIVRPLDLADRALVGRTPHVFATEDPRPDGVAAEDFVLSQCKRYAARVLEDTVGRGDLETAGRAPHRLVAAAVRRTEERRCPSPDETGPELEPDSGPPILPEACRNAPGELPVLSVSPDAVVFGSVNVGSTGGPTSVEVTNTGTGRLCLLWPHPGPESANPEDFPIDASGCTPTAADMAAGYAILDATRPSCTIQVRFAPRDPGNRSAALWVTGTAEPPLSTVRLEGTGQPGRLVVAEGASVCIPRNPTSGIFRTTLHFDNPSPASVRVTSAALPAAARTAGWRLGEHRPSPPPLEIGSGGFLSTVVTTSAPGDTELIVENNGLGGRLSVRLRAAETCP